jgi:hypothetical protein
MQAIPFAACLLQGDDAATPLYPEFLDHPYVVIAPKIFGVGPLHLPPPGDAATFRILSKDVGEPVQEMLVFVFVTHDWLLVVVS